MKRNFLRISALLVATSLLPSCLFIDAAFRKSWKPHQYVLDKGDAAVITKWTLKQDEVRRIDDGCAALLDMAGNQHDASAMEGLAKVHQKLFDGWAVQFPPNFQESIDEFRRGRLRAFVGFVSDPRHAHLIAEYEMLKPVGAGASDPWYEVGKQYGLIR